MRLVELSHLPDGSPTKVAVAGVPQIQVRELLEPTRRVKARGKFVSDRLILNKAVGAGRADGLLVEALGVQYPLFQTRELGANQCRPVCERYRTVICPDRYLLKM